MTHLHRLLARVVGDLVAVGARFALIGGIAVSTRTVPRFTRDLDFAVSVPSDAEAERIVAAFRARGYGIETVLEHDQQHRLATVRFASGAEGEPSIFVDLLFASAGVEPEVVAAATPLRLPGGVTLPVARTGHLIALKVLAADAVRRPQDQVDLAHLVPAADPTELALARAAVARIVALGYARGRDLAAELEAAVARYRGAS